MRKVKYAAVFGSWSSTDCVFKCWETVRKVFVSQVGSVRLRAQFENKLSVCCVKQSGARLFYLIQALPRCNITCNSPTLYDRFRHFSNAFPQIERQQVPSASFCFYWKTEFYRCKENAKIGNFIPLDFWRYSFHATSLRHFMASVYWLVTKDTVNAPMLFVLKELADVFTIAHWQFAKMY